MKVINIDYISPKIKPFLLQSKCLVLSNFYRDTQYFKMTDEDISYNYTTLIPPNEPFDLLSIIKNKKLFSAYVVIGSLAFQLSKTEYLKEINRLNIIKENKDYLNTQAILFEKTITAFNSNSFNTSTIDKIIMLKYLHDCFYNDDFNKKYYEYYLRTNLDYKQHLKTINFTEQVDKKHIKSL
ncbi:MAG: hypothetical protein RSB71_03910 [Bacilli bacterium]